MNEEAIKGQLMRMTPPTINEEIKWVWHTMNAINSQKKMNNITMVINIINNSELAVRTI